MKHGDKKSISDKRRSRRVLSTWQIPAFLPHGLTFDEAVALVVGLTLMAFHLCLLKCVSSILGAHTKTLKFQSVSIYEA